ncbi:MAG: hypothetical protein ACLT98_18355 [Eggerthellaceae bacterium]
MPDIAYQRTSTSSTSKIQRVAWARSRHSAIASRIGRSPVSGGIAGYLGNDFTLLLPHGLIDEKRVEAS